MPLTTIRQARTGKALFWCCVHKAWGPLAIGVPGMHQQIMPAGAAPCAGRLADMTRDARPAMDAGNNDRLASIPNKKQNERFRGGHHEALADRTVAVDRAIGLRAAACANNRIRLDPQSASAAAQPVFLRSVGRVG